MKVYMATYNKLNKIGNEWVESKWSNHTFYIFAEDDYDANQYLETALAKVNEHADDNTQYVYDTDPKLVNTLAVTHDLHNGTSITGIWS